MKVITFVYGVLCYAAFFVVFLVVTFFMANLFVPKTIDSGAEIGMLPALGINALLLTLFAIQHSVMARPAFKAWWTKIIGKAAERSTYVLFSSLALALLVWQWQPVKTVVWQIENETLATAVLGLFFLGNGIVFLSSFMINHFDLFGLKQVYENLIGKKPEGQHFTTNYLYQIVRHPIMLGFLIMLWAAPTMTVGHLFFSIGGTAYIYVAVKYFEEKDLRNALGDQYVEYQKKVPMLIPFFGWK